MNVCEVLGFAKVVFCISAYLDVILIVANKSAEISTSSNKDIPKKDLLTVVTDLQNTVTPYKFYFSILFKS